MTVRTEQRSPGGRPRVRSREGGYTLVEVAVAVAVLSVLSVVALPQVVKHLYGGQTAALAENLDGLNHAIQMFRVDVGRYPSRLSYLSAPPPGGATDSCGREILTLVNWRGPYVDRSIPGTGMVSGTSIIQNGVRRNPMASSSFGTLLIDVTDVDRELAEQMEAAFDGNADFGAGTIVWVESATTGQGLLTYNIPSREC